MISLPLRVLGRNGGREGEVPGPTAALEAPERSCAFGHFASYTPSHPLSAGRARGWACARSLWLVHYLGTSSFSDLAELIEPTLRDMGFDLVLVRVLGNARRTLQVMAEPSDRSRLMRVEDCAEISHALSAVLDVADPI